MESMIKRVDVVQDPSWTLGWSCRCTEGVLLLNTSFRVALFDASGRVGLKIRFLVFSCCEIGAGLACVRESAANLRGKGAIMPGTVASMQYGTITAVVVILLFQANMEKGSLGIDIACKSVRDLDSSLVVTFVLSSNDCQSESTLLIIGRSLKVPELNPDGVVQGSRQNPPATRGSLVQGQKSEVHSSDSSIHCERLITRIG